MSPERESIRTAVFGGSGYIAGELLRLLVQHPRFKVVAPFSTSQAGEPVTSAFPTLAATAAEDWKFAAQDSFESVVTGKDYVFSTPIEAQQIPEPATWLVWAGLAGGLAWRSRRRSRRNRP